jgi:hypothetical protein
MYVKRSCEYVCIYVCVHVMLNRFIYIGMVDKPKSVSSSSLSSAQPHACFGDMDEDVDGSCLLKLVEPS